MKEGKEPKRGQGKNNQERCLNKNVVVDKRAPKTRLGTLTMVQTARETRATKRERAPKDTFCLWKLHVLRVLRQGVFSRSGKTTKCVIIGQWQLQGGQKKEAQKYTLFVVRCDYSYEQGNDAAYGGIAINRMASRLQDFLRERGRTGGAPD